MHIFEFFFIEFTERCVCFCALKVEFTALSCHHSDRWMHSASAGHFSVNVSGSYQRAPAGGAQLCRIVLEEKPPAQTTCRTGANNSYVLV